MDELIHSFGPDDRGKVAAVQETLRELASIVAAKEKSGEFCLWWVKYHPMAWLKY